MLNIPFFFSLLNLKFEEKPNSAAIEAAYRRFVVRHHPDKLVSLSEEERETKTKDFQRVSVAMALWRDLNARATEIARIAALRAERGTSNINNRLSGETLDLGSSRKRCREQEEEEEEKEEEKQKGMPRRETFADDAQEPPVKRSAFVNPTSEDADGCVPSGNTSAPSIIDEARIGTEAVNRGCGAASLEPGFSMQGFPAPAMEAPPPAAAEAAVAPAAAAAAAPAADANEPNMDHFCAPAAQETQAQSPGAAPASLPLFSDRDRSSRSSKDVDPALVSASVSAPPRPYVRRELPVRLEQLYSGCTKRIRLDTGSSPASCENTDSNCNHGAGSGAAGATAGKILEFQILPGWGEGSVVVFQGASKDLHIAIKELPHERFVRCGDDLVHVVDAARCVRTPMGSLEALVTCIDGTTVRVRKDVEEDHDLPIVLRGYGMPRKGTAKVEDMSHSCASKRKHAGANSTRGDRGDLIVRFTNICREIAEGSSVAASESFSSPPVFTVPAPSAPSVVPQHPWSMPSCSQQMSQESGSPRKSVLAMH